jgi:hypothetical protein
MSCGCGKKTGALHSAMAIESQQLLAPSQWGPILWNYLHCLAENIGRSGNTIVDTDQATFLENMITALPLILPCQTCQAHAASYLEQTPTPALRGLYGVALQQAARSWLFYFHNYVRALNQQPTMVSSVDECAIMYANCTVSRRDYTAFVQAAAAAVRQGWVRIENWRKWYSYSERIRILSGNMVL